MLDGRTDVMGLFRSRKHRGDHRYYLLPGMGRSNRRFRKKTHVAAVIVGIIVSIIFGAILWYVQKP